MSTRSAIALEMEDATYLAIYCHNDGYVEGTHGVGYILVNYYTEIDKIRALISLGGLSVLKKNLGEPHDFNDFLISETKEWTVAYHRDRKERLQIYELKNLEEVFNKFSVSFYYVFRQRRWLGFNSVGIPVVLPPKGEIQ